MNPQHLATMTVKELVHWEEYWAAQSLSSQQKLDMSKTMLTQVREAMTRASIDKMQSPVPASPESTS